MLVTTMKFLATLAVTAVHFHSAAAAPVSDAIDAAPHLLAKRGIVCAAAYVPNMHASRDGFWQCYWELLAKGNNGQQCVVGNGLVDMCIQGDAKVSGQMVHQIGGSTSVNCANIADAMLGLAGCEYVGGFVIDRGVPGNGDIDLMVTRACYPSC